MIVIATVVVQAQKREVFLDGARACIAATRQEAGCQAYDIYESATAPHHFVFVERWQDRAAIDAHMREKHLQHFLGVAKPCLAAPPVIEAIEPKSIDRLL